MGASGRLRSRPGAGPKLRLGARPVLALLTGTLLAAALPGCGSSGPSRPPAAQPSTSTSSGGSGAAASGAGSPIRWTACLGTRGPRGYQCATVAVPRDPDDPGRGTIAMAIDRRPAGGSPIGSLLVNPGGPGASGVDALPGLVAAMPKSLLSKFDVVGFDPPGVGRTAPIRCLDPAGLAAYTATDPAPTTAAGLAHLLATDQTFARGCQARSGAELPYVSTVDAAKDLDVLRAALGDAKLTYLGYSYGTLLGATYAGLFPTRIRAMVLDGPIDPALPVLDKIEQQSESIDDQLDQFFSACRNDRQCPWRTGGDPAGAFRSLLQRVQRSPLPAGHTDRTVGPAAFLYGTAEALYDPATWFDLAEGLQGATKGDGTILLKLFDTYGQRRADGSYSNLVESNQAVDCLDAPRPTVAEIEAAAPAQAAAAPVFGLLNLYSDLDCALWPVPATGRVGPIRADGSPPIVVVGSTGDPVTPYRWAQSLTSELAHGVLLTRTGDGHTAYAYSSCIRTAVDRYLTDLAGPKPGTRCASR